MTDNSTAVPAEPAPPSPYPTVQILQAAMAHRESIRSSFESQRAALTEAIAAQRQAVNQAVANTRQGSAMNSGAAQCMENASSHLQSHEQIAMPDIAAMPCGEKLLTSLTLLTAPEAAGAKFSVAQRAMITREFFQALKLVIAEEVAEQIGRQSELSHDHENTDIYNSGV